MVARTPFELCADLFVVSVYLAQNTDELVSKRQGRIWAYHRSYIGHEISFRGVEGKVDGLYVFTNDDAAAGVVSSSEKEIIGDRRH